MILTETVTIKIAPSNKRYWLSLGYSVGPTGGCDGMNTGQHLDVSVKHLQAGSNVDVECICDVCQQKYTQRFSRNTDVCYPCRKKIQMAGNKFGAAHKGKRYPQISGENHPRWNPNKKEFAAYSSQVRKITEENYRLYKNRINPNNLLRGRCGVEGVFQLDHIISIKRGFENGLSPKEIGALTNLQMLSWQENRTKGLN